jgi:hypothetical protein
MPWMSPLLEISWCTPILQGTSQFGFIITGTCMWILVPTWVIIIVWTRYGIYSPIYGLLYQALTFRTWTQPQAAKCNHQTITHSIRINLHSGWLIPPFFNPKDTQVVLPFAFIVLANFNQFHMLTKTKNHHTSSICEATLLSGLFGLKWAPLGPSQQIKGWCQRDILPFRAGFWFNLGLIMEGQCWSAISGTMLHNDMTPNS